MAWQQRTDVDGARFYLNTATGASSWLKLADDAPPSAGNRIAPSDSGAFDYDAFWRDAWRAANATAPPAWLGRRPPRVFVYDDLPAPFSDWSPDGSGAEATAFGRPLGGSVYDPETNRFGPLDVVEAYDIEGGSWSAAEPMGTARKYFAAVAGL